MNALKTRFFHPDINSRNWFLVDASGISLGRVCTKVASILRGKNRTDFSRDVFFGDSVVVINASKVVFTGDKLDSKRYYWHTGRPGGIKYKSLREIFQKNPSDVIFRAVKGMLMKNRLGKKCNSLLRVYADSDHPHTAQRPICV